MKGAQLMDNPATEAYQRAFGCVSFGALDCVRQSDGLAAYSEEPCQAAHPTSREFLNQLN